MRIVKNTQERMDEILDVAEKLFMEKGFDSTSTNDIIKEVGIARGTLYHHFESKESIMDAIIYRYSTNMLSEVNEISNNKNLSISEKVVKTIMALKLKSKSNDEIKEHLHKSQNALMHHKIQKVILQNITPVMANIVNEGIEEDLFNTPYPYESMEMIIIYANTIFDDNMIQITNNNYESRVNALIYNIEKILEIKDKNFTVKLIQLFKNSGDNHE